MIARLLLVLSFTGICSYAQAQSCHGHISYSSPCSDPSVPFKTASAVCKSGVRVTAAQSGYCQSAASMAASIASQCSTQCVAPPPLFLASSFRAAAVSHEPIADKPNFVKVTWQYTEKSTNYNVYPYQCVVRQTHKYIAILDKSNSKNAAYFAANPVPSSTKFLSVRMGCSTSTTSTKVADASGSTTTFANGCYVYSSSLASDPYPCRTSIYMNAL